MRFNSLKHKLILVFTIALSLVVLVLPVIDNNTEFGFSDELDAKIDTSPRKLPDFAKIKDVKQKKEAFFNYLRPDVEQANKRILKERNLLLSVQSTVQAGNELTSKDNEILTDLLTRYHVEAESIEEQLEILLRRIDVVPTSLVLIQAAKESGWGTSRFARQGYNFFGIWCFTEGCGMIPSGREGDAVHEVKSFDTVKDSVWTYMKNINTHSAYLDLRKLREQERKAQNPIKATSLVDGLLSYSERGQDYVSEITDMLEQNKKYLPE